MLICPGPNVSVPSRFIHSKHNVQGGGIKQWSLWEVLRSWGWSPYGWYWCSYERDPTELQPCEDTARRWLSIYQESESHSVGSDSATPWTVTRQAPLFMGFSRQNAGVGCHALLQVTYSTQEFNSGLLHCRWLLYHLSHQASPFTRKPLPNTKSASAMILNFPDSRTMRNFCCLQANQSTAFCCSSPNRQTSAFCIWVLA